MTDACAICFTPPPLPDAAELDGCSHAFCFPCISRWASTETRCPLCRTNFSSLKKVSGGGAPMLVNQRRQVYVWDGVLEAEDAEPVRGIMCRHCQRGDDEANLLLCHHFERCGMAAHTRCLGLAAVPDDDWLCQRCVPRPARSRQPRTASRAGRAAREQPEGPDEVTDDTLDGLGRAPSPDDASRTRDRRWVSRQRAIAASVDAQRAVDARGGGEPAARRARRTGLRTVHELRANWDELRTGVLTFAGLVPLHTAPPARRRAPPMLAAPPAQTVSDAERAWESLDALRSAPAEAPRRPAPKPAPAPVGGHLEHIAWAKRRREERAAGLSLPLRQPAAPPPPLPTLEAEEAELLAFMLGGGASGDPSPRRPTFRIPRKS